MTEGNLRKKFHGWVLPEEFIPHYQHVHKNRHSLYLGHLVGLRQPAHVISYLSKEKEIYLERIVYVGCVHGGSEDIFERLKSLVEYPPDYLIFTGDITGSAEIEKLKKHFYDLKGGNSSYPPLTLKGGKRELDKFEYFGSWAATLPKAKREELLATLPQNAEKILTIVQKIRKKGTKIYFLEGNWDNPNISGVKAITSEDIVNVFDTREFFRRHGFSFINHLTTIETKTSLQVLLPYITLLHFDGVAKHRLSQMQKKILDARKRDKTIVMVGHAEANWRVHHLKQKIISHVGRERMKVIENFGRAMALFTPHEVIYPHQHGRIRDEKGKLVDINSKYILEVYHDGIRLVDDPDSFNTDNNQIIATYVPLGYLAEEDFVGVAG